MCMLCIMNVILNTVFWKCINDGNWLLHIIIELKSIYYIVCGLEMLLRTADGIIAYLVVVMMRLKLKYFRFYRKLNRFDHTDLYGQNT